MNKDLDELKFSPWEAWATRSSLRLTPPRAGVYLFGFFRSPPVDPPTPGNLPLEVIYVGDAKNLNVRPLSEPRHKVILRVREMFPAAGLTQLYVSVCALYDAPSTDMPDGVSAQQYAVDRTHSCYIESWLALKYAERHQHPPILQVKDTDSNQRWIGDVVRTLTRG